MVGGLKTQVALTGKHGRYLFVGELSLVDVKLSPILVHIRPGGRATCDTVDVYLRNTTHIITWYVNGFTCS